MHEFSHLAIVEDGAGSPLHLARWDWPHVEDPATLCGLRISGSAEGGYESGCPDCADAAVRHGISGVQTHDGAVVNLQRVVDRDGAGDAGQRLPRQLLPVDVPDALPRRP